MGPQPLGLRGGEPAQLAHQPEQGWPPDREPKGRPHDGVDALERLLRCRPHGRIDDHRQLTGRGLQHGVDELLLAGEPVQDGLLADADGDGDLVQ